MKLEKMIKTKFERESKRVGRGIGSGKGGHTTGRGNKGQKARFSVSVGFEGGQVPLYKRLPQMGGFKNPTNKNIRAVPLSVFNIFEHGTEVTPEMLIEKGYIGEGSKHGVKVLATGKLEKKVVLKGFIASKEAIEAIKKAGATLA
ncbi:50S ribosomal protein L15 [candidate division WWE3 bacterium]|nr:50S ribosomal protein L15 [candidate division WWE3 bacterium]